MKHALLLIFFCTCLKLHAQDWLPQGHGLLPFGYMIVSISTPTDSVIWLTASSYGVALSGNPVPLTHDILVRRSVDAGQSWQSYVVEEAQGRISFDIEALDGTTAWLTTNTYGNGLDRSLYMTTDGGETWTPVLTHAAAGIFIQVFDDGERLFCANADLKAWSSDYGESWSIDTLDLPEGDYTSLASGNNALSAVGDTMWYGTVLGNVIRTTNYGEISEIIPSGVSALIQSISFIDHLRGILYYYNLQTQTYGLRRTYDGGTTWEELPSAPTTIDDFNIAYIPGTESTFIAYTDFYLTTREYYWSTDFGETWTYGGNVPGPTSNAVIFRSPTVGWGTCGRITSANQPIVYKWTGEVLSGVQHVDQSRLILNITPNPVVDKLEYWFDGSSEGTHGLEVIDIHGRILLCEDGRSTTDLDVSFLPSGIHLLRIKTDKGSGSMAFVK